MKHLLAATLAGITVLSASAQTALPDPRTNAKQRDVATTTEQGSGSSASTVDGSLRSHTKYDHTKFKYLGRSYGAGTSVGLSGRVDPFSRGCSFHDFFLASEAEERYVDRAGETGHVELLFGPDVDDKMSIFRFLPLPLLIDPISFDSVLSFLAD